LEGKTKAIEEENNNGHCVCSRDEGLLKVNLVPSSTFFTSIPTKSHAYTVVSIKVWYAIRQKNLSMN